MIADAFAGTLVLVALALTGCTRDLTLFEPSDAEREPGLDAGLTPMDSGTRGADARVVRDASLGDADLGDPTGRVDDGPDIEPGAVDGSPSISDRRVVAAFSQTCAIHHSDLYCWGDNRYGQRGGGASALPTRIEVGPFSEVCAAEEHSCALRTDGIALCWGANDQGQLGVGDRAPRIRPTRVVTEEGARFVSIACGGKSTCAIGASGELTCWGDNAEGKLGELEALGSALPVRVAPALRVGQVSIGQGHACAVALGGALHCWGRNSERQVGVAEGDWQVRTPRAVDPDNRYLQVGAGQRHSCAIRRDGRLFCWGDQQYQLLGSEPNAGVAGGLRQVGGEADYAQVVVSWFHSCARRRDGSLRCWGRNDEGQLGVGDTNPRRTPSPVLSDQSFIALAVGQRHSCGLGTRGLVCWGQNSGGELGSEGAEPRLLPSPVPLP